MLKPRHGNFNIDYLKIDIESSEWDVLPQILESGMMDKVKQLALEVHFKPLAKIEEYWRYARILKSLEDYGMVRFNSKVNLLAHKVQHPDLGNAEFYSAYELVWYNSRFYNKDI